MSTRQPPRPSAGLSLYRVGLHHPLIKAEPARPRGATGKRARASRVRGPCPQREDDQPAPKRRRTRRGTGGSRSGSNSHDALLSIAAAAATEGGGVKSEPQRQGAGLRVLYAASEESKDRPAPAAAAEQPSYNAADAARVRALIARLGMSQTEVASACGVKEGVLSKWLNGRLTHLPSVLKAGAAAMRWHQENKDRPTLAAAAGPPP